MTSKAQALYALMEDQGYSYGLMQTVIRLLQNSNESVDEMILYIEDNHPTENQVIEHTAALCAN